jgi:hypothetical protein
MANCLFEQVLKKFGLLWLMQVSFLLVQMKLLQLIISLEFFSRVCDVGMESNAYPFDISMCYRRRNCK